MKKSIVSLGFLLCLVASCAFGENVVSVQARQRWPWNGKFDVAYVLQSENAGVSCPVFALSYRCLAGEILLPMENVEGEGAKGVVLGNGTHTLVWDSGLDVPGLKSDNLRFGIKAYDVTSEAAYIKVGLGDGSVSYGAAGPDCGASSSDKTKWLWLRRVEAGSFTMGSDSTESQRDANSEISHQVTLSKAFYLGVFEFTQGQAKELGYSHAACAFTGDYRPLERVTYNGLRGSDYGATWPAKTDFRVDSGSFFDLLRAKTGYGFKFDLPTEAQWEFACRGSLGSCGKWNDGSAIMNKDVDDNLNVVGWNKNNSAVEGTTCTHEVGLLAGNSLGLYDMHGNVGEICLDWYVTDISSLTSDPVGPETGTVRVSRGGYYKAVSRYCRAASRYYQVSPSTGYDTRGFRVCLHF